MDKHNQFNRNLEITYNNAQIFLTVSLFFSQDSDRRGV